MQISRKPFDGGRPSDRINPLFRSTAGNPFKDKTFMDAAKGVTEGRTPFVLRTRVGDVVLMESYAPAGVKPEIALIGVVVKKLDYEATREKLGLRSDEGVVDTLFGKYLVRIATSDEVTRVAPELERFSAQWSGIR